MDDAGLSEDQETGTAMRGRWAVCLDTLEAGRTGAVYSLSGGRNVISRLATLGFTPGAELTMIQNFGWGPIIVAIRDTRIALGRGEAKKVRIIPTI